MSDFSQLTERQREIYDFVKGKIETRGYGPTVREIGLAFEIRSPNGVMCHLKALETKGLILRESFSARAAQLTSPDSRHQREIERLRDEIAVLRTESAQLREDKTSMQTEMDQLGEQLYCARRDLEVANDAIRQIMEQKRCFDCQRLFSDY